MDLTAFDFVLLVAWIYCQCYEFLVYLSSPVLENTSRTINNDRYGGFSNRNPSGSRMTSIGWINEAHKSLLLMGSDDGVVRIWNGLLEAGTRGAGGMRPPQLVTALHAATVR